jgi:integrase
VSHIQYTISRSGTYYYNRRVPKHAVNSYGLFIRQALSKDPLEAEALAKRLSDVLEGSWSAKAIIPSVNISTIIASFKPRRVALSEIAAEYLAVKQINQTPPRVALDTFISLAGDRDVSEYTRQDAKLFVHHLELKGNKTATIRRRINSLSAIINYAYSELDLDKRNPFTKLYIRPNSARRLKNKTSERVVPLVGYAKLATEQALIKADDQWLFPQYIKSGHCYATHASNAVNKWLKKDFVGLTAHCLRHTFRDRMRAVECPSDMIDQIGGWRSVSGIGARYGQGYNLEQLRIWLIRCSIQDKND